MSLSNRLRLRLTTVVVIASLLFASMLIADFLQARAAVPMVTNHNIEFKGHANGSRNMQHLHNATRLPEEVNEGASITVLIHGQGGSASHWSNRGVVRTCTDDYGRTNRYFNFAYRSDSMIESLRRQAGGAVVYWAEMTRTYNEINEPELHTLFEIDYDVQFFMDTGIVRPFILRELVPNSAPAYQRLQLDGFNRLYTSYRGLGSHFSYYYYRPVTRIVDVSQHAIIVFESAFYDARHISQYYELVSMLSMIKYDYLHLTGRIPRVNFVSHSRGGLIAMMYATGFREYSKIANVEYSMGLPAGAVPLYRFGAHVDLTREQALELRERYAGGATGPPMATAIIRTSRYRLAGSGYVVYVGSGVYQIGTHFSNTGRLKFAHPFNVGTLMSMGTPYNGTSLESIGRMFLGSSFNNFSAPNILSATVQQEMRENWKYAIQLNSNIVLHTLVGETSLSFIMGLIEENIIPFALELENEVLDFFIDYFILAALGIQVINGLILSAAIGVTIVTKGIGLIVTAPILITSGYIAYNMSVLMPYLIRAQAASDPAMKLSYFARIVTPLLRTFELFESIYPGGQANTILGLPLGDLFIDTHSQAAMGPTQSNGSADATQAFYNPNNNIVR
ncbi:MAG: hypothetical protein FWB72_01870 [Firmicutes bacterium]|nr:hypothetical protein [Bacillota bacterium]